MKKIGTLNSQLSRVIASMGHSDRLVICDSGLPIPRGMEVVDLALTANIPRFVDTVRVVLQELQVERAVIARELAKVNGGIHRQLVDLLKGVSIKTISHAEFKKMSGEHRNTVFVRTGEASPYANVILVSGVTFG